MEEISEVFNYAQDISVYTDGIKCTYSCGSDDYNKIMDGWTELIAGSHQMPAYGVSLNDLTQKAMTYGLWVEFDFKKQYEVSGLPFEKLLVEVNSQFYGFNLIRYTSKSGYDGRCFYLDLVNKNMSQFCDLLMFK